MEQQVGPRTIVDSWRAMQSLPAYPPPTDVIEAISGAVHMGGQYSEFALRLRNADLPGDPVRPRFADLDGHFPDGQLPFMAR